MRTDITHWSHIYFKINRYYTLVTYTLKMTKQHLNMTDIKL